MYSPVGQNPPGMLDQGSQVEHTCCWRASCWIFQILSWITLVAGIIMAINGTAGVLGAFGACYLIYIILEFCTPTSRYLCHKSTDQGMYEKMGRNFKTPPEVLFHCECYHYETRHHTRTKQDGTTEHYTTQERVTTYTETYSLPYYSERDVSGLFYLNCAKAEIEQKFFIKLELKEEINFADAISYYDYQAAKRHFWIRNRFRDVHFRFWEDRRIPGMDHHNLVKMGPVEPCAANWGCFFLCVMVMGGEFFRLYIDNMSVYQKFKVRKLISTRYDLNQPVYQVLLNDAHKVPTLKDVIVATGTKVAIGKDLQEALTTLLTDSAGSIKYVNTDDKKQLIDAIIKANKNLKDSVDSADWELIGADLQRLQEYIDQLEKVTEEEKLEMKKDLEFNEKGKNPSSSGSSLDNVINTISNTVSY